MKGTMILKDGKEIYPGYMSKEDKENLKRLIGTSRDYMYCSCKAMVPDNQKLFYRISTDNKFIPCHQGYKHEQFCPRHNSRRSSAYIYSDATDQVVTYLNFNPLSFTTPKATKDSNTEDTTEEEAGTGTSKTQIENSDKKENQESSTNKFEQELEKEPYLTLGSLVRSLNIDAYMERLITKGNVLPRDYFENVVLARTKKIYISGVGKSLRELSIKEDKCSFFYCQFLGMTKDENGYWHIKLKMYNREYSYYINTNFAEKIIKEYARKYSGENPTDRSIMAAGFIYKRVNRQFKEYYTIGRIHLFKTTKQEGIYCDNNIEKQVFELIQRFSYYNKNADVKMHIPLEREKYICELVINNKKGYIFSGSNKNAHKEITALYCNNKPLTPEELLDFAQSL